jgi:hypothetical protein
MTSQEFAEEALPKIQELLPYAGWVVFPALVMALLCGLVVIFTDSESRRGSAGAVGFVSLCFIAIIALIA